MTHDATGGTMDKKTERPFLLMIDSGAEDEPDNRHFGSLAAALAAFEELDPEWQRWTWIIERRPHDHVAHMRDGVSTNAVQT